MRQLSTVVRDAGVQQDEQPIGPIDEQLRHFDNHLLHAKGLARSTRLQRVATVRVMLSMVSNAVTPSAVELRHFLTQELLRMSPASGGVNGIQCLRSAKDVHD
jgi:hypothetical protein